MDEQRADVPLPVLLKVGLSNLARLEMHGGMGIRPLVARVIDHVKAVAKEESWPLKRIEVTFYQDLKLATGNTW